MKILHLFLITLVLTTANTFAAGEDAAIEAKEKAAWAAFSGRKPDDFKKLVWPELTAVYAEGANNLQGELDSMNKMEVKSSDISDFKVTMAGTDIAMDTYTVKLTATMNGQDMSGTHQCATIWQQRNGEWRAIFHTDMKAEAATK